MNKIMPNNLKRGFDKYQEEFEQKAIEVLRSGWYILGNEVKEFEKEFGYSKDYIKKNSFEDIGDGVFRLKGT